MNESAPNVLSVGGLLGERLGAMWHGNLRVLDWQRDFLAPFRQKRPAGSYVGMGKTLSGLIHTARLFGEEADALRRRVVSDLLAAQEPDGYLGLYHPEDRTWKEWDVHEQAYIIQALVENAASFQEGDSLKAAERLGRWLLGRLAGGGWRAVAENRWSPLVTLGLDRAMLRLTEATGDRAFADFALHDLDLPNWFDPIVEGRWSNIAGHAYAYLGRCLGQLESLDDVSPLPAATRAALGYLLAGGGLVISGTCGQGECWHSDQRVDGKLGETCTTAYLIRWAAHLLRRTRQALYGDLIERSMYNALFAAASPDGRRIRYYTPAEGPRTWHDVDTYCCPGNYRRILGELPSYIAHGLDGGLAVSLYEPCELELRAGDAKVALHMETDYPFDNKVTLRVSPDSPTEFSLRLRLPGWCTGADVTVSGEAAQTRAGGWLVLRRRWESGDRVDLTLKMPWRLVRGFRSQRGRAALMRGPVVWAASAQRNPELADDLSDVVLDARGCELDRQPSPVCRAPGTMPDGRNVTVCLTPFFDPDVTATYFPARADIPDQPDHLLGIAPPATGAEPAAGA